MRHRATYDRSLSVLAKVKAKRGDSIYTKSGLMLVLGETEAEVMVALEDLRRAGCDILTLGQYLQPSLEHLPVVEFVSPAQLCGLRPRGPRHGLCPCRQRPDGPQFLPCGRVQPAVNAPAGLSPGARKDKWPGR